VCSVLPQWQLTDPASVAELAKLAVGRVLIIIDSFRAACLSGDENASEFAAPLADLSKISEATGCTFMLNHHSGKNNSDRMRSARGTSAITAACSVHWSFEREDLDPATRPCLQLIKSRNHATEAMVWETYVEKVGTAESFQLHARAQPAPEPEDVELEASILDAIANDSFRNIPELAKALGRRKSFVEFRPRRVRNQPPRHELPDQGTHALVDDEFRNQEQRERDQESHMHIHVVEKRHLHAAAPSAAFQNGQNQQWQPGEKRDDDNAPVQQFQCAARQARTTENLI